MYGAIFPSFCFQFHYGTIKSQQLVGIGVSLQSFNSTMVRLKALVYIVFIREVLPFNSTMVRLKVNYVFNKSYHLWTFNSTMVRLKAAMW